MCREIDSHQFTLLVQALDVTPADIRLGNWRLSNLHTVAKGTKERVLHLGLLLLIQLTIAHKRIKKHLAFGIGCKEVFTTDTKAIETTTKRQ